MCLVLILQWIPHFVFADELTTNGIFYICFCRGRICCRKMLWFRKNSEFWRGFRWIYGYSHTFRTFCADHVKCFAFPQPCQNETSLGFCMSMRRKNVKKMRFFFLYQIFDSKDSVANYILKSLSMKLISVGHLNCEAFILIYEIETSNLNAVQMYKS